MKDKKLEDALKQCDEFIGSNATIQLIKDDTTCGGITFSSYDISSVEYLVDTVKRNNYMMDKILAPDKSKELSSMDYYNQYRDTLNKTYDLCKIIDEMAYYISQFRDCPFENEGIDLGCENQCGKIDVIECWKKYFYMKAGVTYDE